MKLRDHIIIALLIVIGTFEALNYFTHRTYRWEYEIGTHPSEINKYSEGGWELVAVQGNTCYYKRRI